MSIGHEPPVRFGIGPKFREKSHHRWGLRRTCFDTVLLVRNLRLARLPEGPLLASLKKQWLGPTRPIHY